jgi:hypothetical protein
MPRKSDVKRIIFEVWEQYPQEPAKNIREKVIGKLGLKKSKGGIYPGLRLVQQYVKEFTDNLGQLVGEDKPWSLGVSVRFGLSSDSTKDLFDIWRISLAMNRPISIRQAKWIVYLRHLYRSELSTGNSYSDKVKRNLWLLRQSWLYAIAERSARIMGEEQLDTSNLDAASFMFPWEFDTAIQLNRVSQVNFSPEALEKIEKSGTSLISPNTSIKSVEQAVWHNICSEPPMQMEIEAIGFDDEVLPEEQDLIAAYWLSYLSKGPLWNKLDEHPDIKAHFETAEHMKVGQSGGFVTDSAGYPDDSLYSCQFYVRQEVLQWVKTHFKISFRDYYSPDELIGVFNAVLLKMVGYEVNSENMELWLKQRESELRSQHEGFISLPVEIQKKFINGEETLKENELLEEADSLQKVSREKRQHALETELVELVKTMGGPKNNPDFWELVGKEWERKHPNKNKILRGLSHWENIRQQYLSLAKERK